MSCFTESKDARTFFCPPFGQAFNPVAVDAAAVAAAAGGAGTPPLPHESAAAGKWKVEMRPGTSNPWDDQPAVAVRALARAEGDRLEAARAAAWDAAAARGAGGDAAAAATTTITGTSDDDVNGTYDSVPGERAPGGAPVYKRRADDAWGGEDAWLFLGCDNRWFVGPTEAKDAREARAWARTTGAVADGTLPHEAPAGGWTVCFGTTFTAQPAVTVKTHQA